MQNDGIEPLLLTGKSGKPTFGMTMLRLYRDDAVWRGAVDLILIGTTLMLMVWGMPGIFTDVDKLWPFQPKPPVQTSSNAPPPSTPATQVSPAPPKTIQPAFSPAPGLGAISGVSGSSPAVPPASTGGANVVSPMGNFSPAPVTAANSAPFNPVLAPATKDAWVWSGHPTADDLNAYESAKKLIGPDSQQAITLLQDRAARGDANAQALTGAAYLSLDLQQKNRNFQHNDGTNAVYWYRQAALSGQYSAQYELGQIFRMSLPDVPIDGTASVQWYDMAARNPLNTRGDPENELARLYESGKFVQKDLQIAEKYYEISAGKGNTMAEANLGAMYFNGETGTRDVNKALEWTRKSAEAGSAQAQHNLAVLYLHGDIGPPDYAQFLKWAGMAADQGSVPDMMMLGDVCSRGGAGFPPDQKLAAQYYRLAALKKNPKAQFILGEMYEKGLGVPADRIQSYIFYSLARDAGFAPAFATQQALEQQLSPQERDYALKMSKALTAQQPATLNAVP